jgi:hypothetical protein
MTLSADFLDVFAVPGEHSIVDAVNPETGRSVINDETLEQIRLRYPAAVVMAWEDWRSARAAEQDTPITWQPITAEQYQDWLEVLPPLCWRDGGFLVSEPHDHSMSTGKPRYQGCRIIAGQHVASSRPVTVAEFQSAMKGGE